MGTEQDNHLVSLTFHFVKVREQSNTLRITKKPKNHNPTQNKGIIIQAKLARILRIFRECFSVSDFEVNYGVRNLPLIL